MRKANSPNYRRRSVQSELKGVVLETRVDDIMLKNGKVFMFIPEYRYRCLAHHAVL